MPAGEVVGAVPLPMPMTFSALVPQTAGCPLLKPMLPVLLICILATGGRVLLLVPVANEKAVGTVPADTAPSTYTDMFASAWFDVPSAPLNNSAPIESFCCTAVVDVAVVPRVLRIYTAALAAVSE